jgi:hypothetical protein
MSRSTAHVFDHRLRRSGHVRRFAITSLPPLGWEVLEEEDSQVVRRARYTDWHRVERARTIMGLKMSTLTEMGWVEDLTRPAGQSTNR